MLFGGASKCKKCSKSAYANESIKYDNQVWHKVCFKCINCDSRVSLNSVAMLKSELYCKNCFIRMFTKEGNYKVFDEKKNDKARSTSEPVKATATVSSNVNNKPIVKVCAVAECEQPCVLKKLYCVKHTNATQTIVENASADPILKELMDEINAKSVIGVRRVIDKYGASYILSNVNNNESPIEIAFTSGFITGARLMVDILKKKLDSSLESERRSSIPFANIKLRKSPVAAVIDNINNGKSSESDENTKNINETSNDDEKTKEESVEEEKTNSTEVEEKNIPKEVETEVEKVEAEVAKVEAEAEVEKVEVETNNEQ